MTRVCKVTAEAEAETMINWATFHPLMKDTEVYAVSVAITVLNYYQANFTVLSAGFQLQFYLISNVQ